MIKLICEKNPLFCIFLLGLLTMPYQRFTALTYFCGNEFSACRPPENNAWPEGLIQLQCAHQPYFITGSSISLSSGCETTLLRKDTSEPGCSPGSRCPNPFQSVTTTSLENKTCPWPELKGSSHLSPSGLVSALACFQKAELNQQNALCFFLSLPAEWIQDQIHLSCPRENLWKKCWLL